MVATAIFSDVLRGGMSYFLAGVLLTYKYGVSVYAKNPLVSKACKVISIVDVSYGGENGFNQAIELFAEALDNVKCVQEKKLLDAYFDKISQDTGKFCYGIDDTLKALDLGAVEKLIVFENLETIGYTFKDAEDNEIVKSAVPETKDKPHTIDKATGQEMDAISEEPLIEWLAANCKAMVPL